MSKEAEAFRYFILAAQRSGQKLFKRLLQPEDITPSQAEVISILARNQRITLKELGNLLICEDGSPSRLINRMVKEELISRTPSDDDGRSVKLALTAKGMEKHLHIQRVEQELYNRLEGLYSPSVLHEMNDRLEKLLQETPDYLALQKRGFVQK